jgi:hypothetical protein
MKQTQQAFLSQGLLGDVTQQTLDPDAQCVLGDDTCGSDGAASGCDTTVADARGFSSGSVLSIMDAKTAIETGDAAALRRLLAEVPARADELIRWGKNCRIATHPLHFISDMLFGGILQKGKELPLLEALIQAGANLDFQRDGKGDTPLIGAASLGAEEVGLKLLDAGARPQLRGLSGETALHWAALLGEDRLAARLIQNADPNLKDEEHQSSSLGWAVHGWCNSPGGNHGRQLEVVRLLVAAGARVEPEWMESERVASSPEMLVALGVTGS